MSEMIERVANAIYNADGSDMPLVPWDDLGPDVREIYLYNARAAIAAMRDPDEVMVQRAYEAVESDDCWHIEDGNDFLKAYRAVIDTALSSSETAKNNEQERQ